MSARPRRARLRALAKINLGLKVLERAPDGYHELRTVFQTVSLADTIEIAFTPASATSIELRSSLEIPDNLISRAAALVMNAMGATGRVELSLLKKIPMGAGLGGGSSDAAAILLALPVLAAKRLPLPRLLELAACLGSDVPFFLLGGTAVALGRGTELYPLPETPAAHGLIVAPGIHVSTSEAYRALERPLELTSSSRQNIISSFQSFVWEQAREASENDFEDVVFSRHPELKSIGRKLEKLGARPARLSGSGSALFGLFPDRREADRARDAFPDAAVFPVSLVSRARYHALWWRTLGAHMAGKKWPPQSRYS